MLQFFSGAAWRDGGDALLLGVGQELLEVMRLRHLELNKLLHAGFDFPLLRVLLFVDDCKLGLYRCRLVLGLHLFLNNLALLPFQSMFTVFILLQMLVIGVCLDVIVESFVSLCIVNDICETLPPISRRLLKKMLIEAEVRNTLVLFNTFLDVHQFQPLELAALDLAFDFRDGELSGSPR